MGSAGHTMEFLATALDKEGLQEPWVKRAVLDVCKTFRKTKPVDVECGALPRGPRPGALSREGLWPADVRQRRCDWRKRHRGDCREARLKRHDQAVLFVRSLGREFDPFVHLC